MNRWQPLYLLGCIGLSAGINHVMRPRVDYSLSAGERTMTTGSLTFEQEGRIYRFKLGTIHVVSEDVPRLFTEPLSVRALWLRSPEETGQTAPDLELLFDIAAGAPVALEPTARNIEAVRSRPLAVLPEAPGAEIRSHVRLPGTEAPAEITAGDLVISEALQLQKGDPTQGYRVRGEMHLTMLDGERERPLAGKFDARLVW